ncbi:MAG: carboxylase [Pelagibacteraceae bacterium]|nr:carboxylase [Pelagibacteraceae bacterium]|tara:strand:- start:2852 stop:4447 length:1596 start_codon:yes stop_codon:yes gene_type:complete
MAYKNLRDYLAHLQNLDLLHVVEDRINKDTELVPLVRLQFRGLAEAQRKAFWFRNVTDARGRDFDTSVVLGSLGSSRQVYASALGVEPHEIGAKWASTHGRPLNPVEVERENAPVKEFVYEGNSFGDGVDRFPHLISTPGFDPAPFLTAGVWITRDPETGSYNLGIYRGMIKAPDRIGCATDVSTQHLAIQWEKARRMGKHLECAVFLGGPPALLLAAASKVPYGVEEYGVAGALNGEPISVVPAETFDCLVPAEAEIVMEGIIRTDILEPEAPFGEASGYLGPRKMEKVFEVSAVTHRADPIYQGIISEFPPSESTVMRKAAFDAIYLRHLRDACNIPSVTKVACHEMASCNMLFVIQLDRPQLGQPWQALRAAAAFDASLGKIFIAVDADVDPDSMDAVLWALSYATQPHRDAEIIRGKVPRLDPSITPSDNDAQYAYPDGQGSSAILINAVREHPYLPVSLPREQFMTAAKEKWTALGLPDLDLQLPWHGYPLSAWSDENVEEAEKAITGRYFETGEKLAGLRQNTKD